MPKISTTEQYTNIYVERQINEIDKWLGSVYGTTWKELSSKVNRFANEFDKKDSEKRKLVESGEITKKEYQQWRFTQLSNNKKWTKMRDEIAKKITQTNKIAKQYINGETPKVFEECVNYSLYNYEKKTGISFGIVNDDAIKNLAIGKNASEFKVSDKMGGYTFKRLSFDESRDYRWNKNEIQGILASGIVQGKPIQDIAKDFKRYTGSSKATALRNARTAMTSAQNCGYMSSMQQLIDAQIPFHKQWNSAHDDRTRESHAMLDGVKVEPNETFPNGLRYPADPSGAPAEVYNCRCRMTASIDSFSKPTKEVREYYYDANGKRKSHIVTIRSDVNTKETYKQWLERKKKEELRYKLNNQLFARKPTDYQEIWISDKKEYANVMSEAMINATKENLKNGVFSKTIGDYIYKFVYIEETGDLRIIQKEKAYNIHE